MKINSVLHSLVDLKKKASIDDFFENFCLRNIIPSRLTSGKASLRSSALPAQISNTRCFSHFCFDDNDDFNRLVACVTNFSYYYI